MTTKRVFTYIKFSKGDETKIIKTPNGPTQFAVFVKSTTADDTATLGLSGSFVAAPTNLDLDELLSPTAVEGYTTVGQLYSPDDNKYPYLQFDFDATATGLLDIVTEVYVAFF